MSYNSIANFYDKLCRQVFGNGLLQAQVYLLDKIPAGSRILIAGGGSGQILEEITRLHPSGLEITYVDSSSKMIALARQRYTGNNRVTYINAAVETTNPDTVFGVVMTPFFFDNFTNPTARKIFAILDASLDANGAWLYCDFRNTRILRQRMLLGVMYVFFRLSCGIEARRLPDMKRFFEESGYAPERQNVFLNGFVEAVVYRRY